MRHPITRRHIALALAGAAALVVSHGRLDGQEESRFHGGVELVNVTATVTDRSGRFVPGLRQTDFLVYEDDRQVDVMHFSAERVPVSLGIVLDTSGSMAGDKIVNARSAIERFLDQLLNPEDEVFLYGFANDVRRIQDWTTNREAVSTSLRGVRAVGGTAMYDAIVETVPIAQGGRSLKKAVILISDGNDTNSRTGIRHVRQVVRETEVLVYAVGINGDGQPSRRRRRMPWPIPPQFPQTMGRTRAADSLNVAALREITDESGGRTEVVREGRDLDRATGSIADELSKQYYLGYLGVGHRDGRWHTIRVEVRDAALRVRARRGYFATS